jgi:RimJ/RimL family protein N-acetyltransferase
MQKLHLETSRLLLIPATAHHLRLELESTSRLARELQAEAPGDWPPGEYDRDAIAFFLEETEAAGAAGIGWFVWYALWRESGRVLLVGCGGFLGAPDAEGNVEIGYSIAAQMRGRGLAVEMVQALVELAFRRGAQRVKAHTTAQNPASIAVLRKNGFLEALTDSDGAMEFVLERTAPGSAQPA